MATQQISYLKFGSTTYQLNDKNALHGLSAATSDALGGFKTGFTDGSNAGVFNYGVALNSNNQAFVSIPAAGVTGVTHGLMSKDESNKLAGIESGANKYVHPDTYGVKSSGLYKIAVDKYGHVSSATAVAKADITDLGIPAQDTTYGNATTSTAGLMSTADKGKLDGIASGANKYVHPDTYGVKSSGLYKIAVDKYGHVSSATAVAKADITALGIPETNTTYGAATTSTAGLMTSAMVTKLNGIADGANKYILPVASTGNIGGVKVGAVLATSNTSSDIINQITHGADTNVDNRYYPLQIVDDGKAFVNVPWQPIPGTATGSSDGLMSSAMAAKLDGIATGANKYVHPDTYGVKSSGLYKIAVDKYGHVSSATAVNKDDITILGIPSTNTTYGNATTSTAGLMSTADKSKLDGIASGANNYSLPTATTNALGGIKVSNALSSAVTLTSSNGAISGRYYGVQRDSNGVAFVNVPWTDTTYTLPGAGTLADLQSKSSTSASTVAKVWSPKVLNEWMSDIVGVDLEAVISTTTTLEKIFEDNDKTTGIISQINTKVTKGTYNITTEPTATTTVTSNPTATLTNPKVNYTKQSLTHTSASLTAALGQTDVANDTLVFTFNSGSASLTDGGVSLSGGSVSVSGGSYKTTLAGGSVSLG